MNNIRSHMYYHVTLHNLTDDQKHSIIEMAGVVRFLYNYFIDYTRAYYKENKKIFGFHKMCKRLTEMRHDPQYAWLSKYHVTPERYALKDLDNAYSRFFKGTRRFPRYKSRKDHRLRYAIRNDGIKFIGDGRYAYIPGLSRDKDDLIDCGNHNVPFGKNIKYDDVRLIADEDGAYLHIAVVIKYPFDLSRFNVEHTGEPLGNDVGIRNSATLSNGETYDGVDKHRLHVLEHRRRKLQSVIGKDIDRRYKLSMSTRTKYYDIPKSKNILKKEARLRKTYKQISNLYKTHYHTIAKDIVKRYDPEFVVIEDLRIREMKTDNHFMNHAIRDSRLGILLTYIQRNCENADIPVIKANRFFKSTQTCSRCGHTYKPGESKVYNCPCCGLEIDRDLNASINLRNYGISQIYGLT